MQTNKYAEKSTKFQHITPSDIAQLMSEQGFELISLKSGHAKRPDRAAHQTTIARYRHQTALTGDLGGLKYDIIAVIPHIYGAIELICGVYRLVCSNGLVLGHTIDSYKISHLGQTARLVSESIESIISERELVLNKIDKLSQTILSEESIRSLAINALQLRTGNNFKTVDALELNKLTRQNRGEDKGSDVWSVYNRIQENLLGTPIKYLNNAGEEDTTRRIKRQDSRIAIEVNRALFNLVEAVA